MGKALRIPKEVESVVEDVETGIDSDIISTNDSMKNYNDTNGLMGWARTGVAMTNGLGTVAILGQQKNKVEEPKRGESEGRHSFLFSSSVEIREGEYESLTDFESSWGLRRQVGTGSKNDGCLAAGGGARAAVATAAASPLPLNPIESMAMKVVEMGAEVSSLRRRSEKDGSNCAARLPSDGGAIAIVRWMNVVLDPWGECGGGSSENITIHNMESSMSWLAHREALKKRVMVWCGQAVDATNDIGGPVGLVLDKLSKDCVAVGQCVVRMLCDFN